MIDRRPLFPGGPQVYPLGFGGGHIGSPELPEDQVEKLLNRAVDLGINLFDTARGYGLSEERLGRHLAHRRSEIVLSTKVGYGVEGLGDWTYDAVWRGLEEALGKLRTDYIDVVFLHTCSLEILKRQEVLQALRRAKDQGLIRALGYSGENDELRWALWDGGVDVIQCSVNLCDQRVLWEVLPEAQRRQVGVLAKRPLANAFWRFNEAPRGDYAETYWHRAQAMNLAEWVQGPGDWDALALRFTLFSSGVTAGIIGTSKLDHLEHAYQVLQAGPLEDSLVQDLQHRFQTQDRHWVGQV